MKTKCLSADQLKSFALGRLDDHESEKVSAHVTDCPKCEETLAGFDDTDDTLVSEIRSASPAPLTPPASLKSVMANIANLRATEDLPPAIQEDWVRDYRLLDELGEGGMGTVYKAVHQRLHRTVALKLLPARRLRNRHAVERFEREMQAIGQLDHPAIVRATDAGEFQGTHFLAMDYVHGIDLGKVSRLTGPLSVPNACEIIRVIALGLEYVHGRDLIHRDVKPSNIMLALDESNDETTVKLLDLGLALFGTASEAVDDFTTVGQLMGTLDYMAPEQADNSRVSNTADIYSLGATLVKLLTGKAPLETAESLSPLQKMKLLATGTTASLRERLPEAPEELASLVDRMLQRDPAERVATASEVATAIAPFCVGHGLRQLAETAMEQQRQLNEQQELDSRTIHTSTMRKRVDLSQLPHMFAPNEAADLEANTPLQPAGSEDSGGRRWRTWMAAGFAAPLLALLGVIIWIQTDRGTLKIESMVDDVPIEIRKGKELVESLTLATGLNEVTLKSGQHEIVVPVDYDQIRISDSDVQIERGGQVLVTVQQLESYPVTNSTPEDTPTTVFGSEWQADFDRATYRVDVGDLLAIHAPHDITAKAWLPKTRDTKLPKVKGDPVLILDDGILHLPYCDIRVVGLTVTDIERRLKEHFVERDILNSDVTIVANLLERRTREGSELIRNFRCRPGDTLSILLTDPRERNEGDSWQLYTESSGFLAGGLGDMTSVDEQGEIRLRYLQPLRVAGLSLAELRNRITEAYVDIYHEDSFAVHVCPVSRSGELLTEEPGTTAPAGDPTFDGRTYAEWKAVIERERSPEQLSKAIDALASLSDDSKDAETCELILKIMDRFPADALTMPTQHLTMNQLAPKPVEQVLLESGLQRIKELNPNQITPVLENAVAEGSQGVCLLILGGLCQPDYERFGINADLITNPVRTALFASKEFHAAAFSSWARWGPSNETTATALLKSIATSSLLALINEHRENGHAPTKDMLNFCDQLLDAPGSQPGILSENQQEALLILLEETDRADIPEELWANMTTARQMTPSGMRRPGAYDPVLWQQLIFRRQLKQPPKALRKMLPILLKNLADIPDSVVVANISAPHSDTSGGGFVKSSEEKLFLSTLVIELLGHAGERNDRVQECREVLGNEFQKRTGLKPVENGDFTFSPLATPVLPRVMELRAATTQSAVEVQEATLRRVETLLWAWEQITGEPARFSEPVFPKLKEMKLQLQPKVASFRGRTFEEWATHDGSDFRSWKKEQQKFQMIQSLVDRLALIKEEDQPRVATARNQIAKFALAEFHDDDHWFLLVSSILKKTSFDPVLAEDLLSLMERGTVEQKAAIFYKSLVMLSPDERTGQKAASTRYDLAEQSETNDANTLFIPELTRHVDFIATNLDSLPPEVREAVIPRLLVWPLKLSPEAFEQLKSLSESDTEISFLATQAAARHLPEDDEICEQFIDRLIRELEAPGEDNSRWVNAAMSLGHITRARKGATVQQIRRLLEIVCDESARKCVDVLWHFDVSEDGQIQSDLIPVSRRVMALQVLTEAGPYLRSIFEQNADDEVNSDIKYAPLVGIMKQSSPKEVVAKSVNLLHGSSVAYVESVSPSESSDDALAAEWAYRCIRASQSAFSKAYPD